MSEAEAFEIAAAWSTSTLASFTLYISITFAYLTVAFLVGSKLSRFQTMTISVLYFFGAMVGLLSTVEDVGHYGIAMAAAPQEASGVAKLTPETWQFYVIGLMSVGILVGLYFMWDVRHSKPKQ